jgi:hypothetical protein
VKQFPLLWIFYIAEIKMADVFYQSIEKNEMGVAWSTNGGEERCIQGFCGETWGKRDNLKDPGVKWRIILTCIFMKWGEGTSIGLSWLRIGTGGRHL